MRPAAQWTPLEGLRQYGLILLKKMGFIALGWTILYFCSHPFRVSGVLMLFAPLIGALAGLVIGWQLADGAVEDSGFTGLPLWAILILAGCSTIWIVEGILYLFTRWNIEFGGWMLIMAAMVLTLASTVWRSSVDQ